MPSQAYKRGSEDAAKERAPIFRNVGGTYVAEGDDPQADDWSQQDRLDYMLGYDFGEVL